MKCSNSDGISDLARVNFELLEGAAHVTPEDIEKVRSALLPVLVPVFDEMDDSKKRILAALYQRSFEDLVALAQADYYFTGVHNIGNRLNFLLNGAPELNEKWGKIK